MLGDILNKASGIRRSRAEEASSFTSTAAQQTLPTIKLGSTSAGAHLHRGAALNGLLPSILEASFPEVVVRLFQFWGFESEWKQLHKLVIKIKRVYKDGERQMCTNELVAMWMDDVREAAYQMDDIVDEMNAEVLRLQVMEGDQYEAKRSDFFGYSIMSKLNMLMKKQELVCDAKDCELRQATDGAILPPRSHRPQTSHSIDVSEIHGRDEDINKVVSNLLDQNYSNGKNYVVIGIVGMGGIGKTMLAQLVFRDERVVKIFD